MKITIKNLRILCEKILTKTENIGLKEIDIDLDFYWDLKTCDINDKTHELIVGSFIDDWDNLKKIIDNQNPPTIIDFDRLGNTIKILGEAISKSDKAY